MRVLGPPDTVVQSHQQKVTKMVSDREVKDRPGPTLARPRLSPACRRSGECFFSGLMDAGHSFVGLAIAVQMLVGIRYHGMMLRTFRRVCIHVINMLRELVPKGTGALEASILSPGLPSVLVVMHNITVNVSVVLAIL